MAATPKPDTMYMNIGDMFMRLSNGASQCPYPENRDADLVDTFI